MYYKKKDPDLILWERIKNGEFPYIKVIEDGKRDAIVELYDMKTGRCTYNRRVRTKETRDYQTLQELVDDPRHTYELLYIAPPTMDSPYWLDSISVVDEYGYKMTMLKRYFRIYRHGLRSEEDDYILHQHKKLMEEKGIKHNEDSEYESNLLDDTNYRRRLLLTKRR